MSYKSYDYKHMGKATSQRRWTELTIDCYKRGCVCEGCLVCVAQSIKSQKCQAKAAVLELVRVLGIPEELEKKEDEIVA